MANDSTWTRYSDDWVKMLDQSRLRKERRMHDPVVVLKNQLGREAAVRFNQQGINQLSE